MNSWLITLIVVIWVILGLVATITLVEAGTIGIVFRFKKFNRVLKPGLNFIIPIIETVEHHSTQAHQLELPDEPENIDRENENPEPGKKLPFRILHSGKEEGIFYRKKTAQELEKSPATVGDPVTSWTTERFSDLDETRRKALEEDSLYFPLTSEVAVIVEWYLKGEDEASIRNYISNVKPDQGRTREEEVRKRIEDMASRTLQEFLGPITLGHARDLMDLFGPILKHRLEVLVGEIKEKGEDKHSRLPWGIYISDAYIKSISPGKRVNVERANAAAAVSKRQETIRNAEAVKVARELQADAEKYAETKKGEGEAARLKAVKSELDELGRFAATLDVAETVLPKANVIVMPSDLGAIGGILRLGSEITAKK